MITRIKKASLALLCITTSSFSMRPIAALLLKNTKNNIARVGFIAHQATIAKSRFYSGIPGGEPTHFDNGYIVTHWTLNNNSNGAHHSDPTEHIYDASVYNHDAGFNGSIDWSQADNGLNAHAEDVQKEIIAAKCKEYFHDIPGQPYDKLVAICQNLETKLYDLELKQRGLLHGNDTSYQAMLDRVAVAIDIEACKASIEHCNKFMKRCQEDIAKMLPSYTAVLEGMATDDLLQGEIATAQSTVNGAKKNIQKHQANEVAIQNKLASIQKHLDVLAGTGVQSGFARFWAEWDSSCSQREYEAQKAKYERRLRDNDHAIEKHSCEIIVAHAKFEQAQHVLHAKHGLSAHLKQQVSIFSSLANELIDGTYTQFAGFEHLSLTAQKEVINFVDRIAQEKHDINDVAYDTVFDATVQLADSACQAYHKGNSELGSALINFGHTVLDCAVAYGKGSLQGIGNNMQHTLDHPIQALGKLAVCVATVAVLPLCPIPSAVILGASVAMAVVDITYKLKDLPLIQACHKAGEMSGDFATECLIMHNAMKAASLVTKIAATEAVEIMKVAKQELAAMGKFTKAEIDAFAKAEKLVASSIEGMEITFNAKKAHIAQAETLHLEMKPFDKGKNPVKLGGDGARIVADAQKLTTKELSVIAEKLGFTKTNFLSDQRAVFKKGNRYITYDQTCHNGGVWKMADSVKNLGSKPTRMGTYNEFLTKRIGD